MHTDRPSGNKALRGSRHSPGFLYAAGSVFGLISIVSFLLALSFIWCPDVPLLEPLCKDEHYKYLVPLLIPVTSWFVIANWVGWEYFRYS